jgi:hypothetical protein
MNSLEQQLRSADPLGPPTDDQAARDTAWLRERIGATVARPKAPARSPTRTRRTWMLVAAGAAIAIGLGVVAATTLRASEPAGPAAKPMELALGPDQPSMTSCVPFSVETLSQMPVAFSGIVVDETSHTVLIDVDHWYRGGDSSQVSLRTPEAGTTSIDGLDFEEGQRYLLTATSGVINYCGYSAVWSRQTAQDFAAAFE